VRASYKLETQALVNFLVTTGQKKIGMIYHKDDLTKSKPEDDRRPHAQHGFALVGSASVTVIRAT